MNVPWKPVKNNLWKSLDKGGEIRFFYYFTHKISKYVTGVLEFLLERDPDPLCSLMRVTPES